MSLILGILAAVTAAPAIGADDILANIKAGRMLCSNPGELTKTCTTIDAYAPAADGAFADTGELMINETPLITLTTTSVVRVQNGAICGTMLEADLLAGKVRVNGALLPPDRNAAVLAKVAEKFSSMFGKQACETVSLIDGKLLKFGQIEGVDIKLPGKPVKWIAPGEGYTVASRTPPAPAAQPPQQ